MKDNVVPIKHMDLSNCKLEYIPEFKYPEKIKHLDLSSNPIQLLYPGLESCTSLERLELNYTNISSLQGVPKIPALKQINFQCTPLGANANCKLMVLIAISENIQVVNKSLVTDSDRREAKKYADVLYPYLSNGWVVLSTEPLFVMNSITKQKKTLEPRRRSPSPVISRPVDDDRRNQSPYSTANRAAPVRNRTPPHDRSCHTISNGYDNGARRDHSPPIRRTVSPPYCRGHSIDTKDEVTSLSKPSVDLSELYNTQKERLDALQRQKDDIRRQREKLERINRDRLRKEQMLAEEMMNSDYQEYDNEYDAACRVDEEEMSRRQDRARRRLDQLQKVREMDNQMREIEARKEQERLERRKNVQRMIDEKDSQDRFWRHQQRMAKLDKLSEIEAEDHLRRERFERAKVESRAHNDLLLRGRRRQRCREQPMRRVEDDMDAAYFDRAGSHPPVMARNVSPPRRGSFLSKYNTNRPYNSDIRISTRVDDGPHTPPTKSGDFYDVSRLSLSQRRSPPPTSTKYYDKEPSFRPPAFAQRARTPDRTRFADRPLSPYRDVINASNYTYGAKMDRVEEFYEEEDNIFTGEIPEESRNIFSVPRNDERYTGTPPRKLADETDLSSDSMFLSEIDMGEGTSKTGSTSKLIDQSISTDNDAKKEESDFISEIKLRSRSSSPGSKRRDEIESKYAEAESKFAKAENVCEKIESKYAKAKSMCSEAKNMYYEAENKYAETESRYAEARKKFEEQQRDLERRHRELERKQNELERRVRNTVRVSEEQMERGNKLRELIDNANKQVEREAPGIKRPHPLDKLKCKTAGLDRVTGIDYDEIDRLINEEDVDDSEVYLDDRLKKLYREEEKIYRQVKKDMATHCKHKGKTELAKPEDSEVKMILKELKRESKRVCRDSGHGHRRKGSARRPKRRHVFRIYDESKRGCHPGTVDSDLTSDYSCSTCCASSSSTDLDDTTMDHLDSADNETDEETRQFFKSLKNIYEGKEEP